MTLRSFDFDPGDPLSASELRRLAEAVERANEITTDSPLDIDRSSHGFHIGFPFSPPFPAKITAGTNPYTWVEQTYLTNGTWGDQPGGRSGTLNAYELNGNTGVPANLIVWMSGWLNLSSVQQFSFDASLAMGGVVAGPVTFLGNVTIGSTSQTTAITFNLYGAPSYPTYQTINNNAWLVLVPYSNPPPYTAPPGTVWKRPDCSTAIKCDSGTFRKLLDVPSITSGPSKQPILYLKFDETNIQTTDPYGDTLVIGPFADTSGHSNTAYLQQWQSGPVTIASPFAMTMSPFGRIKGCLQVSSPAHGSTTVMGNGDYIPQLSNQQFSNVNTNLSEIFTTPFASVWLNFQTLPTTAGGAAARFVLFRISNGNGSDTLDLEFDCSTNQFAINTWVNGHVYAPPVIQTGTWYNVVFGYDGTYFKIYVNNQLGTASGLGHVWNGAPGWAWTFYLAFTDRSAYVLQIDELSVYADVLSTDDVSRLYNGGAGASFPPDLSSSPLGVGDGGTGENSLPQGSLLVGNGSNPVSGTTTLDGGQF